MTNLRLYAGPVTRAVEEQELIHQLRIYEIFEKNKAAFHKRFHDHAMRIMRSYGFNIVAMWESKTPKRTEFIYLLEWPDEKAMTHSWEQFWANEEWKRIKKETNAKHGELVGTIEDRTLQPIGKEELRLEQKLLSH